MYCFHVISYHKALKILLQLTKHRENFNLFLETDEELARNRKLMTKNSHEKKLS